MHDIWWKRLSSLRELGQSLLGSVGDWLREDPLFLAWDEWSGQEEQQQQQQHQQDEEYYELYPVNPAWHYQARWQPPTSIQVYATNPSPVVASCRSPCLRNWTQRIATTILTNVVLNQGDYSVVGVTLASLLVMGKPSIVLPAILLGMFVYWMQ